MYFDSSSLHMCVYFNDVHWFVLPVFLFVNLGNDVDSTTKNMFRVPSLYNDILTQLMCPICKDYWKREPMKMCEQGHNFCNRCQAHISPNASCTAQPSNVRNVALEEILDTAIYPCPFAKSEKDPCSWSGIPFDIESHVRHSHDSEMVAGTVQGEWIQLSLPLKESSFQKGIFTLDNLFFPVTSIVNGILHFSVLHVGHNDDSKSYIYDFKTQNSDNSQKSYNESRICQNYQKHTYEYVELHPFEIQKYLTDKKRDTAVPCDIKIRTVTSEDVEMKETTENTTLPPVSSEFMPADMYF